MLAESKFKMTREQRQKLGTRRVIASVSGGKDSAALALWLKENEVEFDRVFLDTGWEAKQTYDYLRGDLTAKIGPIVEVHAERTMVALTTYKGMFPSKQRRWCTTELKVKPMRGYIRGVQDSGIDPVNAVGIRGAESEARAKMAEWEWSEGFDCDVWRPLIMWSEADVIEIHKRHGLKPNPLYLRGAQRVGCWPCIYSRKSEIRLLAEIDPARIDEIRDLEAAVTKVQHARKIEKGETPTASAAWFQSPSLRTGTAPIDEVVTWSKTAHGGKVFEPFVDRSGGGCLRWGLCDTVGDVIQLDDVEAPAVVETTVEDVIEL